MGFLRRINKLPALHEKLSLRMGGQIIDFINFCYGSSDKMSEKKKK